MLVVSQLYPILPSPLTAIQWWRVAIDEAQRVSTPTAKSAMMALRLHSVHKWAVTGTPVSKNRMADIFGLVLFLDQSPFNNRDAFNAYFHGDSSSEELSARVRRVFGEGLMWRSTKENAIVHQQLNIPKQTEIVHDVYLQPIERAVYSKHFNEIKPIVRSLITRLTSKSKKRTREKNAEPASVANLIARLRACCSHPTVGAHGIVVRGRRSGSEKKKKGEDNEKTSPAGPMTMLQIAKKLVEDDKEKCREDQVRIARREDVSSCIF